MKLNLKLNIILLFGLIFTLTQSTRFLSLSGLLKNSLLQDEKDLNSKKVKRISKDDNINGSKIAATNLVLEYKNEFGSASLNETNFHNGK